MKRLIIFISLFFTINSFASNSKDLTRFNKELEQMGIEIFFLPKAIEQVNKIKYPYDIEEQTKNEKGSIRFAAYNWLTNNLSLAKHMLNEKNNTLKSLNDLENQDVGIIIHELWHAYMDFLDESDKVIVNTMNQRIEAPEFKKISTSKSLEILEEIHAEYLTSWISTVLYFSKMVKKIDSCERYEYLLNQTRIKNNTFKRGLKAESNGYYMNSFYRTVKTDVVTNENDRTFIHAHALRSKIPTNYEKLLEHFWKFYKKPSCSK